MRHLLASALLALALGGTTLAAQEPDIAAQTRAAIDALEQARDDMGRAESARDRAVALTDVVQSYEAGLSTLREATRRLAVREQALTGALQDREDRTANLISALLSIEARPTPNLLLHPGGPAGGLRAGLLLSDIIPHLDTEAAVLRAGLEELQVLTGLREEAQGQLEAGLVQVQEARRMLTQAVANRTPMPKRFAADPVAEAILIDTARSLEAFASELDRLGRTGTEPSPSLSADRPFALPVVGGVALTASGQQNADAASPGINIITQPQAVVASPTQATVRYAGPLLDLGQVVILEPMQDVLFIFAGLETLFAAAGDIVSVGAPLGLMGGQTQKNAPVVSIDSDETGAALTETLYIEVRKETVPQDPRLWFRTEQDG